MHAAANPPVTLFSPGYLRHLRPGAPPASAPLPQTARPRRARGGTDAGLYDEHSVEGDFCATDRRSPRAPQTCRYRAL
jgi:hypothetical protein